MSHLDPDTLALLALGEPVASAEDRAHLDACRTCALELAEISHAVSVGRSTIADSDLETPSDRVWHGISAELGLGSPVADSPVADSPVAESSAAISAVESTVASSAVEDPRARTPRRGIRTFWVLAASLVFVAGIGLGTWAVTAGLAPTSVATASLDAFPDHPDAVGNADVELASDGSRTLVVNLASDDVAGTYREVWLIRNDAGALVSLGVLNGDEGSFAIPDDLDLAEYSLVDISAEPIDGDPAHSGDSIVRGELSES